MKKVYLLLLAAFLMLNLSVQSQGLEKGDFGLNVGIGLGYRGFPIEVSGTYGIVDDLFNVDGLTLSVGGYLGVSMFHTSYYWVSYSGVRVLPAVRVLAHYTFFDKLEVFAGPAAGFVIDRTTSNYDSDNYFGLYGSIAAGAKYYFTDNFGVYAETGYSIGYFMVGATFKF
ncbi:MAG TPA: hypothetical protein PKG88_00830 [Bacteroidales bacterium]|nr:hypothetical protein [Bacteroidales bacterium]HPS70702.1 hypothetical protein [Bacteroidales bacterium]